jgi:hypothetical protein
MTHSARANRLTGRAAVLAAFLLAFAAATPGSAGADAGKALQPCTPKTPAGTACVPFFGGALRIGDPAVNDVLSGSTGGAVTNYSLAGDGTVWNLSFSYSPGDPLSDRGIGFLIYDDRWNLVTLQNATGNPPHSQTYPLSTTNGTMYQVQVFDYLPLKISYSLGVTQGS